MHPVNPLERLGQKWYISTPMLDAVASDLQDHGVGDFIVLMDNSDFCISRTLPLQFPTLDFRHKVSRVRQLFEGYRVPVLSFIHSSFPPPQSLVPGSNSAIGHKPCPISNNSSYLLVFRSGAYKMDQSVDLDLALGLRRNPFHSIISTIAAPATTDTVLPPSSSPRFGKTTASELRSPKANSGATDRQSGLLHIILVETAWKSLVDARSAASQADASPREFGVEIGSVGAFLPRTEWAWTAGAFTCTLTCPEARHLIKAWTRLSNLIRLPQTHLTTRAGTLTVDATKSM
ncbi:unnamed protein product [Protopolystoma xenopodis]|uniref:Uncharacterized protein n=1 Tax=Protopolystoma xenopodis TaxID=117903 RepID=A0A448WW32_9PLAT|nr:unnamed protein product [Protopolystoma xenopodis]